jgi:lipoprotein-releasing system ATP-binding protein
VRKIRGQSTIGVLAGPQVNVRNIFLYCAVLAEWDSPRFFLTTAGNAEKSMLEACGLSKEYSTPAGSLRVLSDVTLTLNCGDSVSITGPSGSGKSTLLYILGALDPPSAGSVRLDGINPYELEERSLSSFRNDRIGFVFQDHHLLPQCDVLENVLIPTLVSRGLQTGFRQRALALLERVGLSGRLTHFPHELSGGEKQRVALARALIRKPALVLCDEPTGNLDQDSAESVAKLLLELHRNESNILVVVTHNMELAARFGSQYRLSDSRLQT